MFLFFVFFLKKGTGVACLPESKLIPSNISVFLLLSFIFFVGGFSNIAGGVIAHLESLVSFKILLLTLFH